MRTSGFLRPAEVAKRYGICSVTLWRWTRQGRIPRPIRLGPNVVAYRISDLEQFEAERAAAGAHSPAGGTQ